MRLRRLKMLDRQVVAARPRLSLVPMPSRKSGRAGASAAVVLAGVLVGAAVCAALQWLR